MKIDTTQTIKILEFITLEYSFADASLIKQNNAALANTAATTPSFIPPGFSPESNFSFPSFKR